MDTFNEVEKYSAQASFVYRRLQQPYFLDYSLYEDEEGVLMYKVVIEVYVTNKENRL